MSVYKKICDQNGGYIRGVTHEALQYYYWTDWAEIFTEASLCPRTLRRRKMDEMAKMDPTSPWSAVPRTDSETPTF